MGKSSTKQFEHLVGVVVQLQLKVGEQLSMAMPNAHTLPPGFQDLHKKHELVKKAALDAGGRKRLPFNEMIALRDVLAEILDWLALYNLNNLKVSVEDEVQE